MALSSAQETPPFRRPLLLLSVAEPAPFAPVCTIRPFTDRDRIDVRPSRRGPFGITVASVFQTVRDGEFVAFSEICPPPPPKIRGWPLPGGNVGLHDVSRQLGTITNHKQHNNHPHAFPPHTHSYSQTQYLLPPVSSQLHPHRANSIFTCQTPVPSQSPLWKVSAPLFLPCSDQSCFLPCPLNERLFLSRFFSVSRPVLSSALSVSEYHRWLLSFWLTNSVLTLVVRFAPSWFSFPSRNPLYLCSAVLSAR